VKKLGKIKIVKLTSNGHTQLVASQDAALNYIDQALSEGYFAFCEPDNVVISAKQELQARRNRLEKVTLYAPVAGG